MRRESQARLRGAVERMAAAIDRGDVTPQGDELRAIALICEEEHLHLEARRVRRWLGEIR